MNRKPSPLVTAALLFASIGGSAALSEPAPSVAVHYDYAGLTQIKIERGQLHYVWHAERHYGKDRLAPARADMSAFDRYEAHIWLTDEEIASVRKWIDDHKVLGMPATYEDRGPQETYGSAFNSVLSVALGERKHSIGWTGDSRIPEKLEIAVSKLEAIGDQIRDKRQKKQ